MGMFSDLLRRMAEFLSDADNPPPTQTKSGIQELAARRLRALQAHLDLVEAQLQLAARNRRDLQAMVAEAKAVEAIGKQALGAGLIHKAQAAMARYAAMQETIRQMMDQAQVADSQAAAAAESFRLEAQVTHRAAAEAKALAQLENVIELQKKHQALTLVQSSATEAFEEAREELLLAASVQAAHLRLQSDLDARDQEIAAAVVNAQAAAVGQRWRTELAEGDSRQLERTLKEEDPADLAIRFLERPPLGGPIKGPGK